MGPGGVGMVSIRRARLELPAWPTILTLPPGNSSIVKREPFEFFNKLLMVPELLGGVVQPPELKQPHQLTPVSAAKIALPELVKSPAWRIW